jgi:hypothetical protein
VSDVIFLTKDLLEQHLVNGSLPPAIPTFIRPTQGKREVRLTRLENLFEGAIEHSPAAEPVVVIEEPSNPVFAGEFSLTVPGLRHSEVIEAQFAREFGLTVPRVERLTPRDDAPLGEPRTVPSIILRNLMKLRKVKGQHMWPRVVLYTAGFSGHRHEMLLLNGTLSKSLATCGIPGS